MKVLHVIETLGIGGAEQMLVNLLPELVRGGAEVSVAVLRPPLALREALEAGGVRVHVLPSHSKWNLLAGARNVARLARENGAAIIHAHLLFPSIYTGLARMLRLTRACTCVTYHNLAYAPGCNKRGLGLELRKLLNRLTSCFGMDGRIAVSHPVAEHYTSVLNIPSATIIPDPIPVAAIDRILCRNERSAGQRRRSNAAIRLILPGRFVHEKGHACFIEAMVLLSKSPSDFHAVFAGDGPLRAEIAGRVAAAGLSERVHITGLLDHASLIRELAAADIVVVPSLFEGFGMTAAEGSCLGKPIVATRTGGLQDVVSDGETGILVEPDDPAALAAAIKRLIVDPDECARLGRAGRERVLRRFDLPMVAEELRRFYRRLISENC